MGSWLVDQSRKHQREHNVQTHCAVLWPGYFRGDMRSASLEECDDAGLPQAIPWDFFPRSSRKNVWEDDACDRGAPVSKPLVVGCPSLRLLSCSCPSLCVGVVATCEPLKPWWTCFGHLFSPDIRRPPWHSAPPYSTHLIPTLCIQCTSAVKKCRLIYDCGCI